MSKSDERSSSPPLKTPVKSSSAAKDPNRPRRKKARRACHACQRAHLTCGDERPCQRCIKRGLQDHCQDGVRKKAKYLHDAPIDAPVDYATATATEHIHQEPHIVNIDPTPSSQPTYHPNGTRDQISINQLSPNLQSPIDGNSYVGTTMNPPPATAYVNPPIFDPSDPAIFNFDISAMNFGSHYGALEFGMLGEMTSGNTPIDANNGSAGFQNPGFSPTQSAPFVTYPDPGIMVDAWSNAPQDPSHMNAGLVGGVASSHGYSIANVPCSITSPSPPAPSPSQLYYDPNIGSLGSPPLHSPHFYTHQPVVKDNHVQPQRKQPPVSPVNPSHQGANKRPKDPSTLYASVTKPYSYTSGYHRLLTLLRSTFPPPALNRIARSMASYRPSFIACSKTLKEDDLVFMEKCFQRTLWEYEKFIGQCGTPTIVWRRTGEVAAVGKEFTNLTSWPKEVLLGTVPNLHKSSEPSQSNQSTDWMSQPTVPGNDISAPKPIFLAELMDQESVVEFYEQFAKLAFGDSRGAVMTKCKLIKYQPDTAKHHEVPSKKRRLGSDTTKSHSARTGIVGAETGMDHLARDGRVECTFCWTVKRDLFDIPMLIVGNFLPIIRGQFPQDGSR